MQRSGTGKTQVLLIEDNPADVFLFRYALDTHDVRYDLSVLTDGPYFGGDFGFSQDPTAAVELYIHEDCLYIRREAVKERLSERHLRRLMACGQETHGDTTRAPCGAIGDT